MKQSTRTKTNYSHPFLALKLVRIWDSDSVPNRRSISHTTDIPNAVRETAKQTAAYVFNPAIVQQLWPPQELAGISISSNTSLTSDTKNLAFNFTHSDAIFKPASSAVSSFRRSH